MTKTIVERCSLTSSSDRRIDRGPDRAGLGRLAHVVERHDHLEVELLAGAGVDELDRAVAGDEAADLLDRALGRGEADPLHRLVEQRVEAFEREREVGAALRPGDGVHLVHDHGLERAQRLARLRGQHQEERLRRRDQDVRRLLDQLAALLLGRVAGADADAEVGLEAGERAAQVPLDVVVERLQRRDVEQAEPAAGVAVELVDPVEERGERLAGAGRRLDQDVAAGGDGGPALRLRGRRPGERALEPGPRARAEGVERLHPFSVPSLSGAAGTPHAKSRRSRSRPPARSRGGSRPSARARSGCRRTTRTGCRSHRPA